MDRPVVYSFRMASRLTSPAFLRALTWGSALVLIAGVIAFVTVRLGGEDEPAPVVAAGETIPNELPDETVPQQSDVPVAARKAAGEFILAAVGREDLAKAWRLAHPELKAQCGCTYKQWLTGNIPVQFYPTGSLQGAFFGVDELAPRRVVLQVQLTPRAGSDMPKAAFYIGLKAVGTGDAQRWLVDYWAPMGSPPIPQVQ